MENPADICTTGIPMSEKGNFGHNKNGCDRGDTVSLVSVLKFGDHDYPSNPFTDLRDPTCGNDAYINNSIQDGFQSQIFCSLVEEAGLQSDLPIAEHSSMEIEAVSHTDTHINFTDSPGTSFSSKIEPFSPMEGLVSSLDDQLDSYLLDGFKEENNSQSGDVRQSVEEQERNVTEAICDIAKSFGLEDLLPETFHVDGSKNGLCVNVTANVLCDDHENIGELSLDDFDRCPELNSPASSLNLEEHLTGSYVLNDLEIIPATKLNENCLSSKVTQVSKDGQEIFSLNSKNELLSNKSISVSVQYEDVKAGAKEVESVKTVLPTEQNDEEHIFISEEQLCAVTEEVSDIPTVSISDAEIGSGKQLGQNCHPAGTVLITTDKASKKMQIVLTLEQGQQIYDIDTDSVDASQQAIDLDLTTSFSENLQKLSSESDTIDAEEVNVATASEERSSKGCDEGQSVVAERLAELICNVPTVKAKKNKTWICPVEECGQILDKECKLRVHMISHKGARPFKCTFEGCDWAFTTPYRLRRHVETHLGCKDFICDFEGCNRKFTTVYNLKTHKKRHKWPNSLTCPSKDCQMSFANRRKLELHLRVHKDVEAPYKCALCGKQYYSANCIASHYRTHQYNEDDFKCPFQGCGKVYDKICRLRQHIRHHTGDRPYTCPAIGCKWSFMSASKLTRHMRKHTGERKFVCTEPGCGKSFMRPEHLKGHKVIHSGDKPFHCPHENCNARFTAKSSLYVHVKKHCPSVLKVVYPCPIESCVKKYNSKATLKQHVQKLHPEILQDGKLINIAEKLELTMAVSVVKPTTDRSVEFLDLEEVVADDPSVCLRLGNEALSNVVESPSSVAVGSIDDACKVVPKISKITQPKDQSAHSRPKEVTKMSKCRVGTKSLKLSQIKKNGCARTDFCCKFTPKTMETQTNFIYLNQNSNDTESKNYLLNQLPTDIKSPDIMLASSIISHENPTEQFLKNHFSSDSSSMSHSLYADESLLVSSGAFGSELIPVSLLSDGVDSDESVLNSDSTGIVFSEQNAVDAFSEHLHCLD